MLWDALWYHQLSCCGFQVDTNETLVHRSQIQLYLLTVRCCGGLVSFNMNE